MFTPFTLSSSRSERGFFNNLLNYFILSEGVAMALRKLVKASSGPALKKVPTGIQGLDEITGGGIPQGRPTLVCGSAGCGKTLLAMEFLVRGAQEFNEPGVFVCFEENAEELRKNVSSLGFDLADLTKKKKLFVD